MRAREPREPQERQGGLGEAWLPGPREQALSAPPPNGTTLLRRQAPKCAYSRILRITQVAKERGVAHASTPLPSVSRSLQCFTAWAACRRARRGMRLHRGL